MEVEAWELSKPQSSLFNAWQTVVSQDKALTLSSRFRKDPMEETTEAKRKELISCFESEKQKFNTTPPLVPMKQISDSSQCFWQVCQSKENAEPIST